MSYEIKKLPPRHHKIIDLVRLGKKQKEIAVELDLIEQTVSSVVNSRVFQEELSIVLFIIAKELAPKQKVEY